MEYLPLRQLRPLLECLRNLYEIRDVDAFRGYLLSNVPLIVPSEMTVLVEVNVPMRQSKNWVMPWRRAYTAQGKIWERHMHEHPVLSHRHQTGDGQALKISDFLTRTQFHNLGLYQEHYRRLGVENHMGVALSTRGPLMRLIGLGRGRRDFSERERLLLNLLHPHLIQGYENATAVTRIRRDHRLVGPLPETPVGGVIVLTSEGRVRVATQQAREWITEYFGRQSWGPRHLPEDLQRWVAQQHALLSRTDDVPVPCEPLVIEREAGRLIIRLLSDADHGVLLLAEQRTNALGTPSEAFGLTRREAEVLAWVTQGKTNAEIGMILCTRPRTVAKHLQRIFDKLGVETRMAAAARALNARIEMASPLRAQSGK